MMLKVFEADIQGSYSNCRGICQSSWKKVGLLGKVKDLGVLDPYDVVTGLWSYNSDLLTTTHSIYMSSKTLQYVVVRNFTRVMDLYATSLYQLMLKNTTRVFVWPTEIIL